MAKEMRPRRWTTKVLKITGYVVGGALLFFIGVGIGSSGESANAKAILNGKALTAQQIDIQISQEQAKLNNLQTNDKAIVDAVHNDAKLEAQIKTDQSKIHSLASLLTNLNTQISSKQSELDMLAGKIQLVSTSPKVLQAGTWMVGKDIPPGRYQATPVGLGEFNFFVYTSNGNAYVNTVLGHGDAIGLSVPSYTFTCQPGDQIQTDAPVKLAPVK